MAAPHEPPRRTDLGPAPLPWPWILGILVLLVPALLRAGFALDDRELLFGNPATDGSLSVWAVFGRDYFHHLGDSGQWRPIASLSLRLDRALFGSWAGGYHLVNGLLHLGVVICAGALLRRSRIPTNAARAGLVIFALHPVLADSVVWIAGRTSMLGALFPLAGAVWARAALERGRTCLPWIVSGVGVLLGLLAKEDSLVFALCLPALGYAISPSAVKRGLLTAFVVIAVWCGGRQLALGTPLPSVTSPVLGAAPLGERVIVGGQAWIEAVRLMLFPVDYPPQYRRDFLAARTAWLGSGTLTALFGWLLLSAPFVWQIAKRSLSFGSAACLLVVISFLPVTQLVPSGEIFAPRFLYLPLLFAIPVLGLVLERFAPTRSQTWLTYPLALLLAVGLYRRAGVYVDQGAWRTEMLQHHPDDAPSWNALGLWREDSDDTQGASAAWRRAIEIDPAYSRSWSNLGRLQLALGDLDAAEITLRAAMAAGPGNAIPRVNLATLLTRQEKHGEAADLYRQATEISPGLSAAWRGLGMAYEKLGRAQESQSALEQALKLDPGDRSAQTLLRRLLHSESPAPSAPDPNSNPPQSNHESN